MTALLVICKQPYKLKYEIPNNANVKNFAKSRKKYVLIFVADAV